MRKEPKKPKKLKISDDIFSTLFGGRPKGARGHAAIKRDKKNRQWAAGLRPDHSSLLNN